MTFFTYIALIRGIWTIPNGEHYDDVVGNRDVYL
jgi:hypothetical protein